MKEVEINQRISNIINLGENLVKSSDPSIGQVLDDKIHFLSNSDIPANLQQALSKMSNDSIRNSLKRQNDLFNFPIWNILFGYLVLILINSMLFMFHIDEFYMVGILLILLCLSYVFNKVRSKRTVKKLGLLFTQNKKIISKFLNSESSNDQPFNATNNIKIFYYQEGGYFKSINRLVILLGELVLRLMAVFILFFAISFIIFHFKLDLNLNKNFKLFLEFGIPILFFIWLLYKYIRRQMMKNSEWDDRAILFTSNTSNFSDMPDFYNSALSIDSKSSFKYCISELEKRHSHQFKEFDENISYDEILKIQRMYSSFYGEGSYFNEWSIGSENKEFLLIKTSDNDYLNMPKRILNYEVFKKTMENIGAV